METTLAMNHQTGCRLLSLPPELRNRIYSYALQPEESETRLLEAKKPKKDLLFSCKQIHGEATKMYTKVYRDFFTKTTFTLYVDDPEGIVELDWLEDPDLDRITHIKITTAQLAMFQKPLFLDTVRNKDTDSRPKLTWTITAHADPSDLLSLSLIHI